MKTNKLGWLIQGSIAVAALAVCASASAGAVKRNTMPRHYKACYVKVSGTNVPQPCARVRGIPSTATPMNIIGEMPAVVVAR
jgi:hypothetical protein